MRRVVCLKTLARLYRAGMKIDDIAKHFGVSRGGIKYNLPLLKVKRRPRGWKPKKD